MSRETQKRLDPAVLGELYHRHAEDLRAFLTGVLRDRDRAAEALQSTFVKAAESGHTAEEETLRGWLFRVAFHEAMDLRRRDELDARVCRQVAWSQATPSATPVDQMSQQEQRERVLEVLGSLPEEQQLVVRLKVYEELTFAEIAGQLQVPLGTVLSRMRLALKKLQERLSNAEFRP